MTHRHDELRDRLCLFVKQYGRKAHPGHDPNDRRYNLDVEALVKRMNPEELDALLHEVEDGEDWLALWMAGKEIPGVHLGLNESVRIVRGQETPALGSVISLLSPIPEPRYVVELDDGRDIECYQSALERAT